MRTICLMNHKGGVGKTTTAINLAAGLSRKDQKVLLLDLDPQSNVGVSLHIQPPYSVYDALTGKVPLSSCIQNVATNFDAISSKENLTKAEYYLSQQGNAPMVLKNLLGKLSGYDFLLIDCAPSLGLLNQNAMSFCKEIFIPTSTDYLGFDALRKMQLVVAEINRTYQHGLRITKVIPTLHDRRSKMSKETLNSMRELFGDVVSPPIHHTTKLKEAPKAGKSIFSYAPSSSGAEDYGKLVDSVLDMGTSAVIEEAVMV